MSRIFMYIMLSAVPLCIFVAAAVGIWVFKDAKKKGLPAAMWALVAVILPGLAGLLIYIVYRADKKPVMLCKSCEKSIDWGASFCPYCGYQSPPPDKPYKAPKTSKRLMALILVPSVLVFVAFIGGIYSVMVVRRAAPMKMPYADNTTVYEVSSRPTAPVPEPYIMVPAQYDDAIAFEIEKFKEEQVKIRQALDYGLIDEPDKPNAGRFDAFSYYTRIGETIESYNAGKYYYSRPGMYPETDVYLFYIIPDNAKQITITYEYMGNAEFYTYPQAEEPPKSSSTSHGENNEINGSFTYSAQAFPYADNNILNLHILSNNGEPIYNICVQVHAEF